MAAPPVFNLPPAKKKQATGRASVVQRWLNRHRAIKRYWPAIAKWAPRYGLDPLMFAALLYGESKGDPDAVSSKGAVGLAQILLSAHPDVTEAQARNPAFAIRWAARFFGQKLSNAGGDYAAAYRGRGGYNPGGPDIFKGIVPKGYIPTAGNYTPGEAAQNLVENRAAVEQLTHADFNRAWQSINNIFYTYQGRKATRKEAKYLINNGFSEFQLSRALSKNKAFYKSPIYRKNAPDYIEVAKTIFGDKIPPGMNMKGLVREAIINNWDTTAFASRLRAKPQYFKSNEFRQGAATLENSYRAIYGEPDEKAKIAIKEATLGRWNQTQWEKYLRDKPEYYNSNEFRGRQYNLMALLGFVPRQVRNPRQPGNPDYIPPDSRRIPGRP